MTAAGEGVDTHSLFSVAATVVFFSHLKVLLFYAAKVGRQITFFPLVFQWFKAIATYWSHLLLNFREFSFFEKSFQC